MLRVWDFICKNCGHEQEEFMEGRHTITCPQCGETMDFAMSAPVFWIDGQDRTANQLRKRSQEHTKRCKEKGIPLDANDTQISSDPVWRNKTRAKNTSRETINQHRNDHLHWKKKTEELRAKGLAD